MMATTNMSEMVIINLSAMVTSNTTITIEKSMIIIIAMMKQFHSVFQFALVVIMKAIVVVAVIR